jgi:Glycosyl hydrolases family 39/Secretion system C-terminal sorting domain
VKVIFNTILIIFFLFHEFASGQSVLNIYPDSLVSQVNVNLKSGVFYVPKTAAAAVDFTGNGIQQNAIRTNVIESALNNATNLSTCLNLLTGVKPILQSLSLKCDKLIFIFEKMPPWLSSSSNGAPASTPGWSILNTKPPSNWNTWQSAVDSITSKIVNQFGIANAYFEVWNEPDLGSWTGSMPDYFKLYQRTFDGVKSANATAKVGGPAVNFWANNIYWQAPYGYVSNSKADSSLIGQLLDSAIVWNKIPDFISWHNFNLTHQTFANASQYIQQKLASLSIPNRPLIVSEWNAPSQIRDTKLAASFMMKTQLALAKTMVANHMIAAWQDFNPNPVEFHKDYGMLTYGAIRKPAYNSVLLLDKVKGMQCKMNAIKPFDGVSAVQGDTLFIAITNYCPPAFVEAFNHTLFNGQFTANQLDSAGYIDIAGNNPLYLDSIYKGIIIIPNSNTLQIAINNAISVYQHYDSITTSPRYFKLNINGHSGNYSAQLFKVDSTQNNMQFKYDSLLTAGYSNTTAIANIIPQQNLNSSSISISGGQYTFALQANAVCLFKILIPGISGVSEINLAEKSFSIYPNPVAEKLNVVFQSKQKRENEIAIYNALGILVKTIYKAQSPALIDVSDLVSGMYFITMPQLSNQVLKFVKQ